MSENDSTHEPLQSSSLFQNIPLEGLTIGIPEAWLDSKTLSKPAAEQLDTLLAFLDRRLVRLKLLKMPELEAEMILKTYYDLAAVEAHSCLARYSGLFYGSQRRQANELLSMSMNGQTSFVVNSGSSFATQVQDYQREFLNPIVQARIKYGHDLLVTRPNEYEESLKHRKAVNSAFDHVFREECCDLILGLTTVCGPVDVDSALSDSEKYLDAFTVPANLAGLPAISLPLHLQVKVAESEQENPCLDHVIGTQLIAAKREDWFLLRVAAELERLFKLIYN